MSNHRQCCCPGEAECTECPTGGTCASRLGYSSVTFEGKFTFDYGFDQQCGCSTIPTRIYDGWANLDAVADIGAITLTATTVGLCRLTKGTGFPVIGTATDVCGYGLPNLDLKPVDAIFVECRVFAGVAYGVCTVQIKHIGGSGFGIGLSFLRYRRPMGTDCKIPLGDYDHYETVLYSTCVDGPNCIRTCIIDQEAIWNIVPNFVTIS